MGCVLHGDVGAQGVPDEYRLGCREMCQQGVEVVGERTGPKLLGKIRIPVAPKIERDDVEVVGEAVRQVVPPVCVRPRAVEEDQFGSPARTVVKAV